MQPKISVAVISKLNVPATVGVPVICPVVGFNVNPVGSDPLDTLNVYGAVPPEPATV
jgi:hypothetical protein